MHGSGNVSTTQHTTEITPKTSNIYQVSIKQQHSPIYMRPTYVDPSLLASPIYILLIKSPMSFEISSCECTDLIRNKNWLHFAMVFIHKTVPCLLIQQVLNHIHAIAVLQVCLHLFYCHTYRITHMHIPMFV